MELAEHITPDFIRWESMSRDVIDVKRCYVKIAGDLVAGVLLSQIIYWFLPTARGTNKVSIRIDDRLWLAKRREDWQEECCISPKQFDRAITILHEKSFVYLKVVKFAGSPTKHISVNWDNLIKKLAEGNFDIDQRGRTDIPQRSISIFPKGEELNTETTAKTTTEIGAKRPTEQKTYLHGIDITEAWGGYLEMRRKLRKPPTEHAVELVLAKLWKLHGEGHNPVDVLEQSILNGWTGVFGVKEERNGKTGNKIADNLAVLARFEARQRADSEGADPDGVPAAGGDDGRVPGRVLEAVGARAPAGGTGLHRVPRRAAG